MSVYIFLFGIMGRIEDPVEITTGVPDIFQNELPSSQDTTTPTSEESHEKFTYETTINVSNDRKPMLGNYRVDVAPVTITPETTPPPVEETTTTTTAPTSETTTTTTTTTEATTTAPPASTTPYTTEEPEGSIEEDDDDSILDEDLDYLETTPQTTTTPEITTNPNASKEQLTVSHNGQVVTDNAVNIISKIVQAEIGGNFESEAIKAQAVAAYTYVKYYNDNGSAAYVALSTPTERVKKLVSEVIGQQIYHNGTRIQAVYCASTAGYSASSENVWGVAYPYLKSKACELDSLYDPNYGIKVQFTSDDIKRRVMNTLGITLNNDPSGWFQINSFVDNIYVGNMSIGGNTTYFNGSKNAPITGRIFREKVMNFDLKSSCFQISYDSESDKFTITTYGYGHGVGMSQNGANMLAKHYGYNYKQILQFYYTGTDIY